MAEADTSEAAIGHAIWRSIDGIIILIPFYVVKSLQLIWRSGTRRWNLRVPGLQMGCSDLTWR